MYQSGLLITALGGPACQSTISRHRQRIWRHRATVFQARPHSSSLARALKRQKRCPIPRRRGNRLRREQERTHVSALLPLLLVFRGIEEVACGIIETANEIRLTNSYVFAERPTYKHPHIWTPSAARHRYPNANQDQGHLRVSTSQIATLEQLLKSVTRVLMIGWRAREARFLPMLRDNLPRRGRGVSPCSRSERRRRPPNAHSVRERSRVSRGPSLHCRRRLQPVCRQPRRRSLPAGLATT